jgi:hypothetical protein
VALSGRLAREMELNADPASPLWRGAPAVIAERNALGELTPGHRTEIRSRWTPEHLYFLFICPYEELHLKPEWTAKEETNRLWEWDVAEVFIGADFENIWRYREYQVSPRGEWVDLDIDRKNPLPEGGWRWNSGFTVAARLDEAGKVWYGAMKIPVKSITEKAAAAGMEFRVNFYRLQGPGPQRKGIAWQALGVRSYHTPEKFGRLRLAE